MLKQTSLLLLLGVYFLSSCKEERSCMPSKGLQGQWIWIKSVGGIGGWTETPESEGYSQKLVIDDYYYQEYRDGSLTLSSQYDSGISDVPLFGTEERTYITVDSIGQRAFVLNGNELQIIDACFDCFTHYYRRN
ncbi:MAG: hypothetical protein J0M29_19610 [Chitinophagales bacterium]|nr:hypothetical protein [Chitinophagales bacterium]